ncbi:MAG: FecR domain-containing protein [Saprospiraceae bacterium]|nr:FecR domain-containing protein [Pyrinomonadaceae bacterium]
MHSTRKVLWALTVLMPLLMGTSVFGFEVDDEIPEVTARVARISFIRGNVQIRREGSQDWERAVLNLPLVEGDELTTDADGRFEIQFNSYNHLRAAENSYLKIVNLKDEGIAVSLPEGKLTLRITEFDKDRTYFEIDAPKTTVAVQRAGVYRVDAAKDTDAQVRVAVTDDGEARVYSDNSGFTLKNGRSAKIATEGSFAGEWETDDASSFADEFDGWSLDRDAAIAKLLKGAQYDKYYDRDIYGAEDLNEYGDWVHTRKYGYVWKPFRNATSQYTDWSPYRYGQWRWVPPYGWTWVNDEPWGWATYHHGRWVYDNGWYWTPYGHYRNRRSWWRPALVVISILNNNICWYPLPYSYGYYNYNYAYYRRRRGHQYPPPAGGGLPPVAGVRPTPTRLPFEILPGQTQKTNINQIEKLPREEVPSTGVISIPASEFGRSRIGLSPSSGTIAKDVLSRMPDERQSPPILPSYSDLNGRISKEIRSERQAARVDNLTATGAAKRDANVPLDQELRKTRILGNREPVKAAPSRDETKTTPTDGPETRKTGAVERPVIRRDPEASPVRTDNTMRGTKPREPESGPPVYAPEREQNTERKSEPVRQPRNDPPPDRGNREREPVRQPRDDAPAPRYDPPPRNETPKNDPPPAKSEPKSPPPANVERKSKDGR